ncbi:hypothetical protein O7635_17220 [Asanoa sp. WMMD1127]|uniref:hypothetical protein n=1 Tax=Asanoa sp. WMMD1127 TaxID=3016107 RepID=UPI002415B6CE|nr:hypothetical protein [Asanoa sp. WMMD1127]MDG4823597.1 hypothetical protein [Asanoa sp. WMMD1127]
MSTSSAAMPAARHSLPRAGWPRGLVARLLTARAVIVDVIELVCASRPEDVGTTGGRVRDDLPDGR